MREVLENQRENLFLYVPFIMAAGGALYFLGEIEPVIPFTWLISAVLFVMMCVWRLPIIIRAGLIFMFGFCYAATYTYLIDTPILNHNLRDVEISGRVTNVDFTDTKSRIYIRVPATELNIDSNKNAVVRVSVDTDTPININDTIYATATLFMPAPTDAPGGFDFARWAYFNGITATGYADNLYVTNHNSNDIRQWIHNRTQSMLVDSLVLGYKHTLPDKDKNTWTSAGIGHIWSISGFHMTLVMGWLFILFYFLFRLCPYIVRRVPAKVPAMISSLGGLVLYVFISGLSVATLRAFLMATLICVAIVLGRHAFSLRNVAIAFCVLFLINPYYIMTAGFQLSFSAIFGLVWFWGTINPKMPNNKVLRYISTAILTATVASVFTAPFIAAHFYSLPIFSIVGNLVLLPVFSILIMPLIIIGTFTATLGIHFPLDIADMIYTYALHIADKIANMPHSVVQVPYISNSAMCFIILGLASVVLIRPLRMKVNYIIGASFILIGIITIIATSRPVFMATADHELVGFVNNGEITFNKSRASNHYFTFDTWKKFAHIKTDDTNERAKHDKGLYIFKSPKFTVAYMQKFLILEQNITKLCNDKSIDYIVSYLNINNEDCNNKILRGGFVIYESGKIIYLNHHRRWNSLPQ
ncbi:MAG: ComEC/Rec2 family competence protein [Alphaproteobacteria bacterium]|nr:ComEC/Rec2 family competence protein [Alphaproteobacteria bacterium]